MKQLVRMLSVGALALGSVAVGGSADANTGPVPEEWGQPTVEFAQLQVVGREMGRLAGRLGNQHVTEVNTYDEDSVVAGSVVDWRCPKGAVAPVYSFEESLCRVKAEYWIDYDYSGTVTENWSPNLRYVNMRMSINLFDASGAIVDQGSLSIHVKATGDVTQTWSDGDYLDILTRQGAHLTGGHFMGKPWLAMSSADVTDHEAWLLRYYDPAG